MTAAGHGALHGTHRARAPRTLPRGRPGAWCVGALLTMSLGPALTHAQPHPGERTAAVVFLAAAAAVAPFDARWTSGLQAPRFQNDRRLARTADVVRALGDPGALLVSGSVLALGALTRRRGLTDAGWHATEAVLASGLITTGLKAVVGRARPLTGDGNDATDFRPAHGLNNDYASFPSGHTTVAFAAAAAFSAELGRSHPSAARVATPALYTAAAAVGLSRMYNNRHWASDVVIGAAVGTLVSRRLVARAHRVRGGRLPGVRPD